MSAESVAESKPAKEADGPTNQNADGPTNQNAAAEDDAKKLLAELETETAVTETTTTETKTEQEQPQEREKNGKADHGRRDRGGDRGGRGGRGSGRGGRGGRANYKDNIKSDLTAQEESSDPDAIRKQVEFYFSDGNLPYDKFLLSAVGGSKNKPVELTTIHSFKRMRHFQPFSAIVEALRSSTLLELTDNDRCVRRKEPLPAEFDNGPGPKAVRIFEDRAMPRCIYAKGFGEEVPTTQFDIEAFFAPYGPTNAVRLRRTDDKLFKGSVFVEFATEELAERFLALDPKPQFAGRELQIMSKKEYCDKKVDDIKAGRIKANGPRDKRAKSDGGRRGGRGDRHDRNDRHGGKRKRDDDDRDWRVRRDEERKRGGDRRNNGSSSNSGSKVETDGSGIPTVKTSESKADVLAKARAVVDSQEGGKPDESDKAAASANGKKREREDEAEHDGGGTGDADAARDAKKSRTEAASGGSKDGE